MVWRSAEDCDSVEGFGALEHLFQRVVYGVAPIGRLKLVAPVGPQVGDGCNRAVWMLVPGEVCAEAPSDHSDTNLARRLGLRGQSSGQSRCGSESSTVKQAMAQEFPS